MAEHASRDEVSDLREKYEVMLELRLADEASPGGDPRREMAALAARFPGALREIDELPLETIRARIEALSRCIDGGAAPEPWMRAMSLFHRLTRGALAAKRWLNDRENLPHEAHRTAPRARRAIDVEIAESFVAAIDESVIAEDARAWATDLARIAAPPRGRITELVFERVAQALNLPVADARRLVVGVSRAERKKADP